VDGWTKIAGEICQNCHGSGRGLTLILSISLMILVGLIFFYVIVLAPLVNPFLRAWWNRNKPSKPTNGKSSDKDARKSELRGKLQGILKIVSLSTPTTSNTHAGFSQNNLLDGLPYDVVVIMSVGFCRSSQHSKSAHPFWTRSTWIGTTLSGQCWPSSSLQNWTCCGCQGQRVLPRR
jgi:hypothetical protein